MLKGAAYFMINEFDELSENGVIGMPEFATAEKGARFLEAAAARESCEFLDQFATWNFQTRQYTTTHEPALGGCRPPVRRHADQLRRPRQSQHRRQFDDAGFPA